MVDSLSCKLTTGDTDETYLRYLKYARGRLSDLKDYKRDGFYLSVIEDVSLKDFVDVRLRYCKEVHSSDCSECHSLVGVARDILDNGLVEVASVFRKHFPKVQYQSSKATRRLMQLPVVVFDICGAEQSFNTKLYAMERRQGVDYAEMIYLMRKAVPKRKILH